MEWKPIDSYSKGELYRTVKILLKDANAYKTAAFMFGILWIISNIMLITAVLKGF